MAQKRWIGGMIACGLFLWSGPCAAADTPWRPANGPLMTRWARLVSPANALPEYPRPQLVRTQWQNLNGLWDYAVTDQAALSAPNAYTGRILVPYPIESALSGVMKPFLPTQRLWYHRDIRRSQTAGRVKSCPAAFWGGRLGHGSLCQRASRWERIGAATTALSLTSRSN